MKENESRVPDNVGPAYDVPASCSGPSAFESRCNKARRGVLSSGREESFPPGSAAVMNITGAWAASGRLYCTLNAKLGKLW